MIRKFSLGIVVLFTIFFVCECFSRPIGKQKRISWLHEAKEATFHHPFVIVICSYNNERYCRKNLESVFEQNYPNYRVIYIDDASTDRTAEEVAKHIQNRGQNNNIRLISNQTNKGALENFYRAIQLCQDEEIAVFLDGDDWFAHENVLNWLNRAYADPNVWMTYGSYVCYPSYKRGDCKRVSEKVHQKHGYRNISKRKFVISHLKTAYVGLLKRIKLQDLLDEGKFFPSVSDQAVVLPAIEMAKTHAHFVRDILYIYNQSNPLNDDKKDLKLQQYYRDYIQALPPYEPISSWKREEPKIDIIVKAGQGIMQLLATLDSINQFVEGYERIWIVGKIEGLEEVFASEDQIRKLSKADYFLRCDDSHLFNRSLDLKQCAKACRDSGCVRLFFEPIKLKNSLKYSQEILAGEALEKINIGLFAKEEDKKQSMSLAFFEKSMQKFIILNQSNLLTKFNEGLKIDVKTLLEKDEVVIHEKISTFIPR